MEENRNDILEETTEAQFDTNMYQLTTEIAMLSGGLYKEAIANNDTEKAKQYFDQWKQACDKLKAFDDNVTQIYKTDKEVEMKLAMNKADNEMKLQIAREDLECRLEIAAMEDARAKAQFIADIVTRSVNTSVDIGKVVAFTTMDCARMAWETQGCIPDSSKTARSMINHGNKFIGMK